MRGTDAGLLALLLAGLLATPRASAEPTATERAIAETLFREARDLMKREQWADACPKLEESQRLDPGGGTLLNLALCHEGQGKLATALMEFRSALAQAKRDAKPQRERLAQERIAAIEARVPRLVLSVPAAARVEGLALQLDGAPVRPAAWQTPIPVDPGEHSVQANAPGRRGWRTSFVLQAGSGPNTIEVPVLVADPTAPPMPPATAAAKPASAPPPPTPPPDHDDSDSTRRTVGFVVGGAGLVAIGIGTYFGLRAISKRGDSNDECPGEQCSQTGLDLNEEAQDAATVSNVTFAVGIAAATAGVVLVLTAGSGSKNAARPTTRIGFTARPGGGALSCARAF